jgi:hypothetical protein
MFLSPLTLQTNLGRIQGAQASLNPYVTYRTVTGKPNPNLIEALDNNAELNITIPLS